MMSDTKWAPDRIWLQRGMGDEGSHTWCENSIGNAIEEAEYVRSDAAPVAPAADAQPAAWRPIETAPKTGRTLLLGYPNSLGKWRTVRGQWMSDEYIAEHWEEPDDVEAGWFETCVEADDTPNCWRVEPTHWMPLPAAPSPKPAAEAEDDASDGELIADLIEQNRTLRARLDSAQKPAASAQKGLTVRHDQEFAIEGAIAGRKLDKMDIAALRDLLRGSEGT